MADVLRFDTQSTLPSRDDVLTLQGVPIGARLPQRVQNLIAQAFTLFEALNEPIGIRASVSVDDFARIYKGKGLNAGHTPLEEVLEGARELALFAVTVGAPVCDEIKRLFANNDPALGCMLDAVASEAAELLAATTAATYETELAKANRKGSQLRVLPYSPGYCGWHVSGQRRLFAALAPEAIKITLNSSCLMQPLKSVSGVLVAAPPEAHQIEPGYSFCTDCTTQACRERGARVLETATGGRP